MAPPSKITDPALIQRLMDLRTLEQVTWQDMPGYYKEWTGEDVNWQTIRSTLRKEAPMDFLPTRVSAGIKAIIEEKTSEIHDVFSLTLVAFNVRFAEYMALVGKQRLAELDVTLPDEEKIGSEAQFTTLDMARMDMLYNDMMSFTFRFAGILREMGTGKHDMIEGMGISGSAGTPAAGVAEETLTVTATIERIVAKVAKITQDDMTAINGSHMLEAKGNYRARPDLEEDLLEEDK